uniref:Uncharacterized protein n=1 Tax=Oryza glumipatula TaxID=40148 RepID=A0A0D9ZC83_9ORYZ
MRGDGSSIQRSVFVISLLNQFHHLYGFIWIRENLQQITPWRRTASMFPHDDRSRSDTLQQGDEKATFQWVKSSTRMQKLVLTNPLLMYMHERHIYLLAIKVSSLSVYREHLNMHTD